MADNIDPSVASVVKEFSKQLKDAAKSAEDVRTSLQAQLALISEEAEVFQSIGQQIDANNSLLEIESRIAQSKVEELQAQLQNKIKLGTLDEQALKDIGEQIAMEKKLTDQLNRRIKASKTLQATTSNIVTSLTGIDDSWKQTFVGSFTESLTTATSFHQVLGDMGAGFRKNITVANVLGSSISKIGEATIAMAVMQEEATAAFSKSTGTGQKYHSMITDIAQENRVFGVTSEDSARAVGALFSQMNLFSGLAPNVQKDLATMVTRLESFGISSETAAANMDLTMRVLGKSAKETGSLQVEVAAYAKSLGLAPQQAAESFTKTMPTLAAYGRNAVTVFKGIMRQSKETGIAMERLVNWGSKMDTYEGAASIAADFNHLMGGAFLNGLELVNASHKERIKLVQDSMKVSGKSFAAMSEHTKRAITHRLGLESIAEAQKLLTPLTKEQMAINLKKAKSDKILADQAAVAQSMMTEMKNAALSLAVGLQPLVKFVSSAVRWISELNDKTKFTILGFKTSFIPTLVLVIASMRTLGLMFKLNAGAGAAFNIVKGISNLLFGTSAAATSADTAAKTTNVAATQAQAASQTMANSATASGVKTMLAMGAALALMGVGVGAAAGGIGFMAKGFSELDSKQINAVLIALGGMAAVILGMGILMLSPVGAGATIGILALGAAIAVMGTGVAIASLGISVLVNSMKDLDPALILSAGTAFTAMSAALLPLMPWVLAGPLLAAVFVAIGAAALMIGGGFSLASSSLQTFDNMLSNISSSSVANLTAIADQVERIVSSVNDMSTLKAALFQNIVAKISPESAGITPSRIATAVTTAATQRSQTSSQTAVQTSSKTSRQSQQRMQPINIVVKVNEKEIGSIAWDKVKEQLGKTGSGRPLGPLSS